MFSAVSSFMAHVMGAGATASGRAGENSRRVAEYPRPLPLPPPPPAATTPPTAGHATVDGEAAAVAEATRSQVLTDRVPDGIEIDKAAFVGQLGADDIEDRAQQTARSFFPDGDALSDSLRLESGDAAWESHGGGPVGSSVQCMSPSAATGHPRRAERGQRLTSSRAATTAQCPSCGHWISQ